MCLLVWITKALICVLWIEQNLIPSLSLSSWNVLQSPTELVLGQLVLVTAIEKFCYSEEWSIDTVAYCQDPGRLSNLDQCLPITLLCCFIVPQGVRWGKIENQSYSLLVLCYFFLSFFFKCVMGFLYLQRHSSSEQDNSAMGIFHKCLLLLHSNLW